MIKNKNRRKPASERKQKRVNLVMTRRQLSVGTSVQTKKSVSDMWNPFSRGSAREKLYTYLTEPRNYLEFILKAKKLGVDPIRTLRFFRQGGKDWILVESNGLLMAQRRGQE
jgi:hypothetical protein